MMHVLDWNLLGRYSSKIDVDPFTGCWLWVGFVEAGGYGVIRIGGRKGVLRKAHRVLFEHFHGAVPSGNQLDHLCRVRNCVNPDHLEPVTPRENTLRGVGLSAENAVKTECKHGHPLSGYNLVEVPGHRYCRTCRNRASRDYTARQSAKANLDITQEAS